MNTLQITGIYGDFMKLHDYFDFGNPIFQWIILAIVIFILFALIKDLIKPLPIINAEIYFKSNSKAVLSGNFEVWPDDRYRHLESGAIVYKADILYIKNMKYIQSTVENKTL